MGSFIAMKQGLIIADVKWTEFKRSKLIHKAEYGWYMIQLDSRTWRLSYFIFVFIDILMKLERCPGTLSWFLTVTFDCLSCDTIPLWGSRCPHFRLDWALAAHSIVTRQLCRLCPYNCIWFKSNNDTGVRSQYNCIWSGCLDTTPMLKPPHWFNDTQNIQTKTLLSPL